MIHQRFKRAVIAAAFGGLSALVVLPTAYAADTLRPEVAKPLNAAQDSYRAHRYQDALAKIAQADAVPNKTPYESYMVEEMRGAAAAAAGVLEGVLLPAAGFRVGSLRCRHSLQYCNQWTLKGKLWPAAADQQGCYGSGVCEPNAQGCYKLHSPVNRATPGRFRGPSYRRQEYALSAEPYKPSHSPKLC